MVDGVWDDGYLELGEDPFTLMTAVNCLKVLAVSR